MASRSNRNIVFSCQDHVVFCRKYRRQVLVNGVERRLQQISAEVAEETDSIWAETEVMPDHVHLLIEVDPRFGIHRVVKAIKGRSSRSLRNEFSWLKSRLPTLWTNSDFFRPWVGHRWPSSSALRALAGLACYKHPPP
jgi:putative transposase